MTSGEIWWVDFGVPLGSLPGYKRPALIIQKDELTKSDLNTVLVVPLSTNITLAEYPQNILLEKKITALPKDCVSVAHLVGPVNKFAFTERVSKLSDVVYSEIVNGIGLVIEK